MLKMLYEHCLPYYEKLHQYRLKPKKSGTVSKKRLLSPDCVNRRLRARAVPLEYYPGLQPPVSLPGNKCII